MAWQISTLKFFSNSNLHVKSAVLSLRYDPYGERFNCYLQRRQESTYHRRPLGFGGFLWFICITENAGQTIFK